MKGDKQMMKISDMQVKDIVNMENGKRLGYVTDIDINLETGQISALIINGSSKVMSFFNRNQELIIPWRNIYKIGDDVILVHVPDEYNY